MNQLRKENRDSMRSSKSFTNLKNTLETVDESQALRKFINDKIGIIQEIIRKTTISIKKNKQQELFSNNELNLSINILTDLYEKTVNITNCIFKLSHAELDLQIDILQKIVDKLSMIICGFGTLQIDDLLYICFGSEFKNMSFDNDIMQDKYELIRKYIQPTGYKIIAWKPNYVPLPATYCSNKITDETIKLEESTSLECFDVDKVCKLFYNKIYGIRIVIQNEKTKKTIIITGIIEEIQLNFFTNKYIEHRKTEILRYTENNTQIEKDVILRVIETMTLKDILCNGDGDIYKKMIAIFTEVNMIKQSKIDLIVKKFLDMDNINQRSMLINLLLYKNDDDIQYICYLLYDLITTNENDKPELYDSLPWKIKQYFKDIIKNTVKYTNDITQKYDKPKISLEQQIHLMKAPDSIKEKAITKLKELKSKPDDSGLKAKQYIDGLLKIPFGIYREEPILKKSKELNKQFIQIIEIIAMFFPKIEYRKKNKYTNVEILQFIQQIDHYIKSNVLANIETICKIQTNKHIIYIIQQMNIIKKQMNEQRIIVKNQTKATLINDIVQFLNSAANAIIIDIYDKVNTNMQYSLSKTITDITHLKNNVVNIETSLTSVADTIDSSIYSHANAKNQIMKIIAQWMNGEQTGYCFGFEGSPGIGKTSLAKKGLSNCLKDESGISRPFSFIALGGSCNGSTLEGHGYTYVNSTWGKIVDILMESKCMNPIIYIDELDKVSKTEHGKEIISIFTHLIDSTQNDTFQDKYFSGIDIDLSKVLFIFSYNDPEQIDKILLDRIHRIKFENLTTQDKIVIVNRYIIPELNIKMGFENVVTITDDIIEFIIESYTVEPGVRKLKELLFDLYGEINLEILKCKSTELYSLPVIITRENLETKYLNKYHKMQNNVIHLKPEIGIINGLWANSLGRGGIIPIQTLYYPSSSFLELQLTGLQGDVMKESMNVAKSLAWNLTGDAIKKQLLTQFENTKGQGLHVHCPEGGISKDGPSAGAAITCAIYSLFNKLAIKNDIALTGEINLSGEVTAIGGLDVKIMGGIKANVKTFLYPKSNNRDFIEWNNKHGSNYSHITFHEVSTIQEVFQYVFA
jgi:ATP-dependent Lon protease